MYIPVIDFHCDTLYKMQRTNVDSLFKNDLKVDIKKLNKANSIAQFFAIFYDNKEYSSEGKPFGNPINYLNNLHDILVNELDKHKYVDDGRSLSLTTNSKQYLNNKNSNVISAFLTIEGAEVLQELYYDEIEKTQNTEVSLHNSLSHVYEKGVRLITLTWNYENFFGFPNSKIATIMNKGLKPLGLLAVEIMNELGIIVDVSHLSDAGFYDVASTSKKPFIASHSNTRAITPHERNLTDDMIKIIANNGGVIGINFCSDFLGTSDVSKISDTIAHIKHIINIGGSECIALGTDFDGIDNECEIKDIGHINTLFEEIRKQGIKHSQIEKIAYMNAERLIIEVLG